MLKKDETNKRKMKLLRSSVQQKEHYKMYKAGKSWLFAGITIIFFGAGVSF